jgi:esterase/lipase
MLGKELQANIFFTRLKGHGQDGRALGEATFDDWMIDIEEAIGIGKVIGDNLVLIGCSTGCSLIHTILKESIDIKAVIYVSPNFGPKSFKGQLLRVPGAKLFMPLVFGKEHFFIPKNVEHERCWTTRYPIKALFAIKDSVVAAYKINHNKIKVPMLFWFSDDDQVVSAKATRKIISKMGNNVTVYNPILTNEDDSSKHGILGDILSASQTKDGVNKILSWLSKYI